MYNRSNLGTFYARKLKFSMPLTVHPDLNFLLFARVAPGSCPGVGLGVEMNNRSDFILTFMSSFLLEVIIWVPFYAGKLKFGRLLTQILPSTLR